MWNTVAFSGFGHCRQRVSSRFSSIVWCRPDPDLVVAAPLGFQLPAGLTRVLGLRPFTRLVHVFSASLGYLTRPYIVHRSREPQAGPGVGNIAPQSGWEHVGL